MKEMITASRTLFKRMSAIGSLGGVALLLLVGATGLKAQTPLYQWNFNGVAGTGAPSIAPAGGGGTFATVIGSGNFNGVGLTAASTDWTYQGATASDGYRTAATISGLGTISNLTVTFWMKPSVAYLSQSTQFGRLLMLGNSTAYDESVGNASPGFSLALSGAGLQYNINNGQEPIVANLFTSYAANQWVFVAVEYDGLSATNSSSALGAAIGNSAANLAVILGSTTASIGAPTMLPLNTSGNASPGPITNTATMALMLGNRASGGRGFQGQIENVNIFTNLLTVSQLETLRISSYATSLTAGVINPANPVSVGSTVTLSAGFGGGTAPYSVQWQTDGGSGTFVFTNIPGATSGTLTVNTTSLGVGNFLYQAIVTDSTTASVTTTPVSVNVIQKFGGTLVATGNIAPTPGGSDAFQLVEANGVQSADGINYFTDNGINNNRYCGQTFTTGSNAKGYTLNSLAIGLEGGSAAGTAATDTSLTYDLFIYKISSDGSTATLIADVTNQGTAFSYPNWAQWNFTGITLTNNATYGYGFGRRAGNNVYLGMATSPGGSDYFPGGQIATFPALGGGITYGASGYGDTTHDAVFDAGLIPNGVPFFLIPATASPNPAYALSPVKLFCKPTTAGIYTYKWMSDDGSGTNLKPVPGATATNVTVVPLDLNPGGSDYTTNYYFVATDTTSGNSVTSSVVALVVHPATSPQFTILPTPSSLVTYVGNTVIYTAAEVGTLPITNQWLFSNGSGYTALTAKTNTTLTLANVQTSSSGSYQLAATNLVGNTNTIATLTVVPAPANPVPATQKYFNSVFTNNSWAYWRLNETNDPTAIGAPTYQAYDYSGHGFYAAYGNGVTVSNAGPQPPAYPGFDANELAAGTVISTPNSSLTVRSLNLSGNSNLTFMAWINPTGGQAASAGLLFNRGGPDNACGFGFCGISDHLGYTWNNNSAATYGWDSTLAVAEYQWNFVAYVITPTNTTVYLANIVGGVTNFQSAVNPVANIAETFAGGTISLGADPLNNGRIFNGLISEATLFTNALSTAQLQQYFLTAIGASSLPPVVTSAIASPADTVYSGQNVLLTATISGSAPLTNRWQVSPDSTTWSDVSGGTNATLLINPQTVGTFYYQLIVANAGGTATGSVIVVNFTTPPSYPAALWTANFQETNNLDGGQNTGGGLGHYVGRGAVGNGMYWNVMPHILTAGSGFGANTINSVTDLMDDGVTHSGVTCRMNSGGSYNGPGTTLPNSSDIGNLVDQWYRTYFSDAVNGNGALQFLGAPAGTYNLIVYAGDGLTRNGSSNLGTTLVVIDPVHGNQTNSTSCPSHVTSLQEGVNFVTFTNVHIGGTLNVDVSLNSGMSGAQLQLVSYDPPTAAFTGAPTNLFAGQSVTFTNVSIGIITNAVWSFGDGVSVTNASNVGVSHTYAAAGTYSVSLSLNGPGGGPVTLTRTGYITVSPVPSISSVSYTGGSFIFAGSNGPTGSAYRILSTTNLMQPLASWTTVKSGVFAPDGSFNYTNSSVTNAASFFRLVSP